MAIKWEKPSKYIGVRYRLHGTRKLGNSIRHDMGYYLHYKVNGKVMDEFVGWASEGMNAEKAYSILAQIRNNIRMGIGPRCLKELRKANEKKAADEAQEQFLKEKSAITFADFWKTSYLPTAEAVKKNTTMESERGLYSKWIEPALGNIPLQEIGVAQIEKIVLDAQSAQKSAATVRYIMAIISQVWARAATLGYVQGDSPTKLVKKPRQDNRRMRFLGEDEAVSLLAGLAKHSQNIHDEALLSLYSGMRAGEIHALTWGDVDFQNEMILIRDPKNTKNRYAYFTRNIKKMFERRYKNQPKNEMIFPATNGKHRRWVSDTYSRVVDDLGLNDSGEFTKDANGEFILDKAGKKIPVKISDARQRVVFHTLRHTFASWLAMRGEPIHNVAELLGHTTLAMTKRYTHLAPKTLRRAVLLLDEKMEQGVVPSTA
ncbi:MAG: site-specific integrase [Prevotellaceae bacterium]|jgi:integrase|nr:site-specific integrase [Prevotellaceae bacterium]